MSEKPRPCDPSLAVIRGLSLVGKLEPYVLGTGDYQPRASADLPFTRNRIGYGSDCWGFAGAWCYKLPRHRPGYNKGPWATVADDLNCDSAIEQAEHPQAADRLWEVVSAPKPGDLLVMPSIRDKDGHRIRIGHVWLVTAVPAEWDANRPQYDLLTTVQCQASSHPAIKKGAGPRYTAETFRGLTDRAWRIRILRAVP